mmetsp:Transcript_22447/g.31205  ORF Transcript_22447/g.31205 Transcript_22447/m.31205 type:complete len:479 (+) Transcript_22447:128-1564(+)|eukprot:CAMPEP_0196588748 /NCGR_PEP_ID=MMETSP1081-20130531/61591_1 /TAXON_ID=36882 /ORGANISM="Pyramimonas amylifera, Strain CCMP720" /LENGTH=478 /DNA_ID=CAMNT_0041911349 /DNA_START=126 /DNA_END=1562 /DNA_ORIENTATION=-
MLAATNEVKLKGPKFVKIAAGSVATFYRRPLPSPPAIPFSSQEGKEIFREAMDDGFMDGYFRLAEQFVTQMEPAFCGLSSLAMVLNTLEIDPRRTWKGTWRWFDERMLDCCETLDKVSKEGIEFHKVAAIAACNGASVRPYHVHPPILPDQDYIPPHRLDVPALPAASLVKFRKDLEGACRGDGSQVLLSYSRRTFLQTGDGHFSPIGGYHREKDLLLILDVARFKYPPHWVKVDDMWEAMRHVDKGTGYPRGYIHLRTATTGRGVLFTLSTQRTLWDAQLAFFLSNGLSKSLAQVATESGESESTSARVELELDAVVKARQGSSVAVLAVRPQAQVPNTAEIRRQVVEALRAHPLTTEVQEALDREDSSYDEALSLCGKEGLGEGLWVREEEEALLFTMLLLAAPNHQWDPASPQLQALRKHELPEVLATEVTTLRSQMDALVRFGCMCGIESEHDCNAPVPFVVGHLCCNRTGKSC